MFNWNALFRRKSYDLYFIIIYSKKSIIFYKILKLFNDLALSSGASSFEIYNQIYKRMTGPIFTASTFSSFS